MLGADHPPQILSFLVLDAGANGLRIFDGRTGILSRISMSGRGVSILLERWENILLKVITNSPPKSS